MQRRQFLAASAATALGLAAVNEASAADSASQRQLIELRFYHFASPQKQQAFDRMLAEGGVAAISRAGAGPVGVFRLHAKDNDGNKDFTGQPVTADSNDLYLIIPHKSGDSFLTFGDRMAADRELHRSHAALLQPPKNDPAFTRYESVLLHAFTGFPQVQVPSKSPGRVAQLRMYESHSNERNKKKVEMFNEGGEFPIFKRCGMNGVFFGRALAGIRLPNLTYMLAFDDEQALKKAWDAFRADPDWKKLSKDPAYKDSVSNITNLILRPTAASQI